ncbi:hypothetical protein DSO57_1015867 [Entomophthora muscae]|uniref:Uncharacterized protein n=1 Tax=Entomophthora muscae TaxID=34485 RepID=A0ACC2UQE5_9FUNG|nr:hypothetical protein DSO57_1015867 [Entomophthora muscae]
MAAKNYMHWFLFAVFVEAGSKSRFTNHNSCSEGKGSQGEGWTGDGPMEGVWLGSAPILKDIARPKSDFGARVSGLWWKGKVNVTKTITCSKKRSCIVSAVWQPGKGWSSLGASYSLFFNDVKAPQFRAYRDANDVLYAQLEFFGPASAYLWFNQVVWRNVERTTCHIGKPVPGQLTHLRSSPRFLEGAAGYHHTS